MVNEDVELFAALTLMPGGITLNQIRQLLPENLSNNEALSLIFENKIFEEDEQQIKNAEDEN